MSDGRWWKEDLAEHYFQYEDEINEQEIEELIQGEDGVYRVEAK